MPLNSIDEIIDDIRLGKMVILMDDEDRENEGDIIMAAECVTPEHIAFMARYACGLICLPMTKEYCDRLQLPLMVKHNGSGFGTKFTVSIEAAQGVGTGISASDRAHTILTAVAASAKPQDLVRPGHVFPLIAEEGGVLIRAGHTEAACDLARLAGFSPSGVICEVMDDDGDMARRPQLEQFAEQHGLKIGTVADLINYRLRHETSIQKISEGTINTDIGEFRLHTYRDTCYGDVHLAISKGNLPSIEAPAVRVQFANVVRDIIGTQPLENPGWNSQRSLAKIHESGGVMVILGGHQSTDELIKSTEIALSPKTNTSRPYSTEEGRNPFLTVGLGSQILRDLGIHRFRLLGKPVKYNALSGFGLEVIDYLDA